ncbi:MAG TPA: permease-like cell division protein FtsX [Bacteroidia bacterium]|nr:permease-like cell division protein FtsX [Bacteroidia bacterium]
MSDTYSRRRIRSSSFTIVISISLVLIMLGLLSVLVLKAKEVSDYVRENIKITVFLDQDAKDVDIIALQKSIDAEPWRKSTEFVSRENAAKKLQKDLGEDFINTLGYNPLQPSIEIFLKAGYANSDSISWIEQDLRDDARVKDVLYQKDMVSAVNERLGTISLVILVFSSALLIVAVGLIFNTIRLAIYSQRFLIRTMQLVGATQGFIRSPFVWRGIINGVIGAIIAILVTTGVLFSIDRHFRELNLIRFADVNTLAALCGLQIVFGIIITWISTSLAVRRFLRQSVDELYSN